MRHERLFLLRVWRDGDRQEDWRASATDLRRKKTTRFASLAALHAFLTDDAAAGGEKEVGSNERPSGESPSRVPKEEE